LQHGRRIGHNVTLGLQLRASIRWLVGAVGLVGSFAGATWFLGRMEHRAYDGLVTTVELGCERDEIRQVGVEVLLWHTDRRVCVPTLTRAEVEPVGDTVFVSLFERCRGAADPPPVGRRGSLPRYVFVAPVTWKRPGPRLYVSEYASGRLTDPRPVRLNPSCGASGAHAALAR
jgi:hypothetical protein